MPGVLNKRICLIKAPYASIMPEYTLICLNSSSMPELVTNVMLEFLSLDLYIQALCDHFIFF